MKLLHWNGCGQRLEDSACSFVISDVRIMKTNGARKMIAPAISRLWSATAIRKRRRRTSAGGFRRTIASVVGASMNGAAHRPPAWKCTKRFELSTIASTTANETASSSIAIAEA